MTSRLPTMETRKVMTYASNCGWRTVIGCVDELGCVCVRVYVCVGGWIVTLSISRQVMGTQVEVLHEYSNCEKFMEMRGSWSHDMGIEKFMVSVGREAGGEGEGVGG